MSGMDKIREYHGAYKAALELHRAWPFENEPELLELFEQFHAISQPLFDYAGTTWPRYAHLTRHVNCVRSFLAEGKKDLAKGDINDIVYADMPELADYLLRPASR